MAHTRSVGYTITNLLSLNEFQGLNRNVLDAVKSPFQLLTLDRTRASTQTTVVPQQNQQTPNQYYQRSGSNNQGLNQSREYDDSLREPHTLVMRSPFEANSSAIGSRLSKFHSIERPAQISRKRKPIFQSKERNIGCWPFGQQPSQDYSQQRVLLQAPSSKNNARIETATEITIKKYQYSPQIPTRDSSPQDRVGVCDVQSLPPGQQAFVELILKVLPKLSYRQSLTKKVMADKADLFQTLLKEIQNQDKHRLLNNLLGVQNLRRIDKRFKSQNVAQFVNRLAGMSSKSMNQFQQRLLQQQLQKIVQLLSEVQNDIYEYLQHPDRIQELSQIYSSLNSKSSFLNRNLATALQKFLNDRNIICSVGDLQPLQYIWTEMGLRPYGQQQFIRQITKNDIVIRRKQQWQDQLQKQGFSRNN